MLELSRHASAAACAIAIAALASCGEGREAVVARAPVPARVAPPKPSPPSAPAAPRATPVHERVVRDYVGSQTCAACHSEAYAWWQTTRHGRAFETLVARGKDRDDECRGCHVTGYGQLDARERAELIGLRGVGCESCHGPGAEHVENPRPPHARIHRAVSERTCVACHDGQFGDRPFEYAPRRAELLVASHGR